MVTIILIIIFNTITHIYISAKLKNNLMFNFILFYSMNSLPIYTYMCVILKCGCIVGKRRGFLKEKDLSKFLVPSLSFTWSKSIFKIIYHRSKSIKMKYYSLFLLTLYITPFDPNFSANY